MPGFTNVVPCFPSTCFRSEDTIKNYIMWRVVDKYVMSMPFQFVQAKRQFHEAMRGVREYNRWSYCLESMMKPMGMTLGRLYVDANFDESTKTTVRCNFAFTVSLYFTRSDFRVNFVIGVIFVNQSRFLATHSNQ